MEGISIVLRIYATCTSAREKLLASRFSCLIPANLSLLKLKIQKQETTGNCSSALSSSNLSGDPLFCLEFTEMEINKSVNRREFEKSLNASRWPLSNGRTKITCRQKNNVCGQTNFVSVPDLQARSLEGRGTVKVDLPSPSPRRV